MHVSHAAFCWQQPSERRKLASDLTAAQIALKVMCKILHTCDTFMLFSQSALQGLDRESAALLG